MFRFMLTVYLLVLLLFSVDPKVERRLVAVIPLGLNIDCFKTTCTSELAIVHVCTMPHFLSQFVLAG